MTFRRTVLVRLLPGLLLILAGLPEARAQDSLPTVREASERTYGTSQTTMVQIPASQCSPVGGTTVVVGASGYVYATGGSGNLDCAFNLPAGARIESLRMVVHDDDDNGSVFATLLVCSSFDADTSCPGTGILSSSGTAAAPQTGPITLDLHAQNIVVDKANNLYFVRVLLGDNGTGNRFREVDVSYRLQISTPPPGTQTFTDVPPTDPYYKAIEALAASGITGGCGHGHFCPGGTVTRAEIAAFFARALGLQFPN